MLIARPSPSASRRATL